MRLVFLVKQVRREKQIGVRELSRLSGVAYQHISEIENGLVVDIKLTTLCKLAKGLGVAPQDLFICKP